MNQRFRPKEHLRRPADFQRVYQRRCSAGVEWLVVYACKNELGHNRMGLSTSKRLGNAVIRNRIRRRLREAYRLAKARLLTGYDLVFVPKLSELPPLVELNPTLVRLIEAAIRRTEK